MQHVRIRSLALASAALLLSLAPAFVSAQSSPTFLVQFGEHDSREAARQQWEDLQKRYPQQLSGLTLHIAPVRFGDEKETYRTQAAGVASYQQAQSVCSDLSSKEVKCAVVETSLFASDSAPAQAASTQASSPAALPSLDDQKPAADVGIASVPAAAAPAPATYDSASVAAEPAVIPAPTDTLPANAPASATAKAPDNNSFSARYLPWLGFGNASNATPEKAVEEEVAAWQQEQASQNTTTRAEAAAATQALPSQPKEVQIARPRPQRLDQATPPKSAPVIGSTYAPSIPAPSSAPAAVAPIATAAPVETPSTFSAASVAVEPTPVQAPAPVVTQATSQPIAEPLQPQAPQSAQAEVEVAEAVQVPVTFDSRPTPQLVNKPAGYGGFPSQPAQPGNSWLQLGYFADKEAAFAFSRELSDRLPEAMQMTRMRITSPFASNRGLKQKVAMRVGPFQTDADALAVCSLAERQGLKCSQVQELGNSATANTPRNRYNGPREQYGRREAVNRGYGNTPGAAPSGAYWVQLGAFDNAVAAQRYWEQLSASNPDALSRLRPQVSYPALSSSPTPVYHLRTGPFVNKVPAQDLCGVLRARNASCILVQER